MKRIEKDGKFYRMRRGVLVEIPEEWVGKTVDRSTINKRPSKQIHKLKKDTFNVRSKRKEEKLEISEMINEIKEESND